MTREIQQRQDDEPSGSATAKSKRIPDVIAESKNWVVDRWVQRVNENADLTRVSLSNAERKDHVPDLLDEAVAHARDHQLEVEERQRAAERHGTLRYHQGYSVLMLILEAQILQDVIADCLQRNFVVIDPRNVIPDITKMSETIAHQLRDSVRAYMRQYEWNPSRPDGSPR